jgi:hypothetical protein
MLGMDVIHFFDELAEQNRGDKQVNTERAAETDINEDYEQA